MPGLVEKLMAAEQYYGEAGVAQRCGVKPRMYQLVKAGQSRFGGRPLAAIIRNFPGLREDVLAYIEQSHPERVA